MYVPTAPVFTDPLTDTATAAPRASTAEAPGSENVPPNVTVIGFEPLSVIVGGIVFVTITVLVVEALLP